MKKTLTLYILLTTFFSSFAQTDYVSISGKEKINIEAVTDKFNVQNYFEDERLSKNNEYSAVRNYKIRIRKTEEKNIINYSLVLYSSSENFATFGLLDFNYIEGFTNKENAFLGLVFKNLDKLDDKLFKDKIDYFQQKFGKPNYQFRDPLWNSVSKKLYSWKINNLIYVAYLDNQNHLRLHIINFDKLNYIENTGLGWKLIDL